jgi:hypothetical protein
MMRDAEFWDETDVKGGGIVRQILEKASVSGELSFSLVHQVRLSSGAAACILYQIRCYLCSNALQLAAWKCVNAGHVFFIFQSSMSFNTNFGVA